MEALCGYLSSRRLLLVLDNCEHLGDACGSLAEGLLSRCSGLDVLATSRHVLGVKGESVWRVPSLALPAMSSNKPISVADIRHVSTFLDFAAIRLFSERAHAAESSFETSSKNAVSVAKICNRLDGIPLAIELAAARVKAMTVEKIAERLNERFRLLLGARRSSSRMRIPRHETLRASIDWSYHLLSEHEQILMRRLAVFVGGWTLEAAEAVCSGDPIPEWEILDLLTSLVEKSLVAYLPGDDRYRLLETIRQYLAERLEEEGEEGNVRQRHRDYFLAFAEEAEPHLTTANQQAWFERLEQDHDNLRDALNSCIDRCHHARVPSGCGQVSDAADVGLRLATLLWRYWFVRGHLQEGRRFLDSLLSFAHSRTIPRARALNCAGGLAWQQGDYDAARRYYEESLTIRRAVGDDAGMAGTLGNVGVLALACGDTEGARRSHEEGLAIHRHHGNQRGIASCLNNLGMVAEHSGDYVVARDLYEAALAINRDTGNRLWEANNLGNLGNVAHALCEWNAARRLHTQSLAIKRENGDLRGIAVSLHNLGRTAVSQGDLASARTAHLEAFDLRRQIQSREGLAESLGGFASLAAAEGSAGRAATLYGAAMALHHSLGAPLAENERAGYDRELATLRVALEEPGFDTAWAAGQAMTLEQAISFALAQTATESRPPA
jgi:predicted ATPase